MIIQVNDDNFDKQVLAATIPVLVDFFADWCAPCKRLKPILEKFAKDYPEYKICEIDVDVSPIVSQKHLVKTIPNLMLFNQGIVLGNIIGMQTEDKILTFILSKIAANEVK